MTEKAALKNWSDEATATLMDIIGDLTPVPADIVEQAATTLGKSTRSVSAKLRQLNRTVASMAKTKEPTFSEDEGNALAAFVTENASVYTYREIAENFNGGKFTAKQIQGKLLALELTDSVKRTEKVEVAGKYSEVEEATFVKMANTGAFIEEIATALGKEVASVRGKALSLVRKEQIAKIPAQRESHANTQVDAVAALGDRINGMTVAEIAAATDKTDRGVRTMLTRRGINCADYKGQDKKEKAEAKAAA
jgi:hypothetical protein